MWIERIDLSLNRLPLVRTFRTSSSTKSHLDHILVRVESEGIAGWGECASPSDPYYCPETVETCWHLLQDFLAPAVLGHEWRTIDELVEVYRLVKGNNFAKAGLEMACWDLLARREGKPLAAMLGGTRSEILSGVSLGIEAEPSALFEQIDRYLEEGYRRVKLKIAPEHDFEVVQRVRERYPDLPLQVDANSAYTLDDLDVLQRLDAFGLLLIEQPLAHDDVIDHARLQAALKTPVCLDESIHSAEDARKAIEIGACRVVNVKVSRLGGLREAKRVHDVCQSRGVPVWCGGMHEFGIGRAANVAIASLAGFMLPGDVSGSDKYYRDDLVDPPVLAFQGAVPVPVGPGLGHEPDEARIKREARRSLTLTSGSRT
ncbi:MAG: o-succinylbenzoate synthase [Isosphaeraceae bacterium]